MGKKPVTDIEDWLENLGLGAHAGAFLAEEVDMEVLPELDGDDLRHLGIPLGPAKKILKAIRALQAQAPAPVTPVPRPGERANDPERRQLTVMFVDLVDWTRVAVRLDPEDLREVMRGFQDCCRGIVERFGGHVTRHLGDGILAFFGYPRASEHDAERAVRAALELADAVAALDLRPDVKLHPRIGIATGEVVVDLLGEGVATEQTALGSTPTFAARLQELAQPDTVVIADRTRQLVGGLFDCADLGVHYLKGFDEAARAWRVTGEGRAVSRFEAIHGAQDLGPLVGRDDEIGLIMRGWEQARGGHGQVVMLQGEAGVGKSRLAQGLRLEIRDEPHHVIRYYCSPYHQNTALHPVVSQLEREVGLARDDPPEVKRLKLGNLVRQCEHPMITALLGDLLGIPGSGDDLPRIMSPRLRKERTLDALEARIASLASTDPLVVLVEDLHWIDPTSLEHLRRLVDLVTGLPVLLLMTHRPEFLAPWSNRPQVVSLNLGRLEHEESVALVTQLTGGRALPQVVLDQIVERSDGVPLYVEEMTKTVLDAGFLRCEDDQFVLDGALPAVAVPNTLRDSLMARLDRLSPVKEVVQIGAVLGRRFSYEHLAAVAPFEEHQLRSALGQIAATGLLHGSGEPPDATYVFKHALLQDAAYSSLLRDKRRALHARIAHVMEQRFPAYAASAPELLAHHCTGAQDYERAIVYWRQAGQRASERSALTEAVDHFQRGLELVRSLTPSEMRDRSELELQVLLGPIQLATEGYAAANVEETYERARFLCTQSGGQTTDLFAALRGLWAYYFVRAELSVARTLGRELLELAEREHSDAYGLEAHRCLGMTMLQVGESARAERHLRAGAEMYDSSVHADHAKRYGNDPGVGCLAYQAKALWLLGRPDGARALAERSIELARRVGHPFTLVQALALAAMIHQHRREPDLALERVEEALKLADEQGGVPYWAALANVLKGWVAGVRGAEDAGLAQIRCGVEAYARTGATITLAWFWALAAEACGSLGRRREGLGMLTEARAIVARTGDVYYAPEIDRIEGALWSVDSDGEDAHPDKARASFRRALDLARRQEALAWELRAALGLARLCQAQGEVREARQVLAPVREAFVEGFEIPDLREAQSLLAALG